MQALGAGIAGRPVRGAPRSRTAPWSPGVDGLAGYGMYGNIAVAVPEAAVVLGAALAPR